MKPRYLGTVLALCCSAAGAHVVVNPREARIAAFQTFSVGVPVEKPVASTGVRLVLPQGLDFVLPNVKPGWTIEAKRTRPDGPVSVIEWSGGSIPPGHREEFGFSAKLPVAETTLQWKAYQHYEDGSVVAWDRDPKAPPDRDASGKPDFSRAGPFSQTRVVDDFQPAPTDWPLWISIAALALAAASLALSLRRR